MEWWWDGEGEEDEAGETQKHEPRWRFPLRTKKEEEKRMKLQTSAQKPERRAADVCKKFIFHASHIAREPNVEAFCPVTGVVKSLFSESIKTFVVKSFSLYPQRKVEGARARTRVDCVFPLASELKHTAEAAREMISHSPYNLLRSATIFFLFSSSSLVHNETSMRK